MLTSKNTYIYHCAAPQLDYIEWKWQWSTQFYSLYLESLLKLELFYLVSGGRRESIMVNKTSPLLQTRRYIHHIVHYQLLYWRGFHPHDEGLYCICSCVNPEVCSGGLWSYAYQFTAFVPSSGTPLGRHIPLAGYVRASLVSDGVANSPAWVRMVVFDGCYLYPTLHR